CVQRGGIEVGLARGQRFADGVARAVDRLARGLALLGGQRAERLELRGDAAALAEQRDPQRLEDVGRTRRGDVGERLLREGFDLAHSGPRKKRWGRTRALPHVVAAKAAGYLIVW